MMGGQKDKIARLWGNYILFRTREHRKEDLLNPFSMLLDQSLQNLFSHALAGYSAYTMNSSGMVQSLVLDVMTLKEKYS